MKTRPTLTLGAFKKDDKEIKLSKVTMDKLAKLAAIPTKPNDKKDVVAAQAATPNKAKGENNNKATDSATKTKKIEAQKPNQPKAKKAGFNKENHYAVMKYLQKNYPKCFPDKPPFVPLAIGIHNQLVAIEGFPFSKTNSASLNSSLQFLKLQYPTHLTHLQKRHLHELLEHFYLQLALLTKTYFLHQL